jgi:hypothetical protein
MEELRRLWCLLDTKSINLKTRYIRSAANVWADKLSRHLDNDDWKLDPVLLRNSTRGSGDTRSIASLRRLTRITTIQRRMERPNGRSGRRVLPIKRHLVPREQHVQPPWPLLPSLAQKLRQGGATATTFAPC